MALLYDLLMIIGFLLYLPRAMWRRRLPHRGWSMRLGRYPARLIHSIEGKRPCWVHAVSVGEVLAARPLLDALAKELPAAPPILSTITPSGFALASSSVQGHGGAAIYFPLDLRACVRQALDALHPRILLLMESELWPAMIRLTKARGIPIAVVNGRISPRAYRRYRLIASWLGGIWGDVDLFLMQSQTDADRLLQLGAPRGKVHVVGSLKWDASLGARPTPQAIQDTIAALGLNSHEAIVVAGSTHRGEETLILNAFRALRAAQPAARLLIAPRHLERLAEVERLIHQAALASTRLSHLRSGERWEVGLVDTFGQLPRYYALASAVFIGGSLIPHGGQNPLEATSAGKAVVFGPHMHNFEAIAHQLLAHHAARQVSDGEELTRLLQELIANPADSQAMGQRAQELTERFRGATQRTLELLRPLFTR